MVIVSDTTTLSNLFIINKLWILEKLYKNIIIPKAVFFELQKLNSSERNIPIISNSNWISIKEVNNKDLVLVLSEILDLGEAEAIALAKEENAELLIIDETKGRNIAKKLSIKIVGLLGILIQAKKENLIENVEQILVELKTKAGFWISEELHNTILDLSQEKRH